MLDNINVYVSDLKKLVPDIETYQDEEIVSFDDIIQETKRKVYGLIKESFRADYKLSDTYTIAETNAEIDSDLEKVKDYPIEEYLKNKVMRISLADIFRMNGQYEEALIWDTEANKIPVKYYIDSDDDSIVDTNEEAEAKRFPTFHR